MSIPRAKQVAKKTSFENLQREKETETERETNLGRALNLRGERLSGLRRKPGCCRDP